MRVRPLASAPSMRARCEIDLSPGTRIRPVKAFDLKALRGLELACGTSAWPEQIGRTVVERPLEGHRAREGLTVNTLPRRQLRAHAAGGAARLILTAARAPWQ